MQDGGTMYNFHSEVFEKVRIGYETIDVVILFSHFFVVPHKVL